MPGLQELDPDAGEMWRRTTHSKRGKRETARPSRGIGGAAYSRQASGGTDIPVGRQGDGNETASTIRKQDIVEIGNSMETRTKTRPPAILQFDIQVAIPSVFRRWLWTVFEWIASPAWLLSGLKALCYLSC